MVFHKNHCFFQKIMIFQNNQKKIVIFHKEIMSYQNIKETMIFHENYRYEKTHVTLFKSKTCLRVEKI